MALSQILSQPVKRATTLVNPRAAALAAQARFGNLAAYLPAYGKIVRLRSDRPGVQGDFYFTGVRATGYGIAPIPGSPLRFLDCDSQGIVAAVLAAVPRLAETYRQDRADHAAFAFLAPGLPNLSRDDDQGHELVSLRGPGLYQIGAGSLHPSGDVYTCNGKPPITLTADECAAIRSLFPAKVQPRRDVNDTPLTSTGDDYERASANLDRISPDCIYADWIALGQGLKAGLGEAGYALWDAWSARSAGKYPGQDATRRKWDSFRKGGRDLRAVTAIANEHDPAGKCKPPVTAPPAQAAGLGQNQAIPNLPVETPVTGEIPQSTTPRRKGSFLTPITWERAIRRKLGRQADAVLDLLSAATQEPQSLIEMAAGDDVRRRRFERALDDYGASRFFQVSQSAAVGHDDLVFSSPSIKPQIPDRYDQTQPAAKFYSLRPASELRAVLLDMLAAYVADKHQVPRFNRFQIAALGVQDDAQAIADDINKAVDLHLSDDERAGLREALARATSEYRDWERALDDMTVAPVAEGAPDDPTLQTVARALAQVDGADTTWRAIEVATALPRAKVRRAAARLGKTTDVRYSPNIRTVTKDEGLPPGEYDPERGGYPDRATNMTDGEQYNLRSPVGRSKARDALQQGEALRIDYASGITVRDMTADEIARRDAPAEHKPRGAYVQEGRAPAATTKTPTLGSNLERAVHLVRWAEMVCKLPDGEKLTYPQRLYRLAGRESMWTPVTEFEESDPVRITSTTIVSDEPLDELAAAHGLTFRDGAYHQDDPERNAQAVALYQERYCTQAAPGLALESEAAR